MDSFCCRIKNLFKMNWKVLDLALWITTYEIQLRSQITLKNNSLINKEKKTHKGTLNTLNSYNLTNCWVVLIFHLNLINIYWGSSVYQAACQTQGIHKWIKQSPSFSPRPCEDLATSPSQLRVLVQELWGKERSQTPETYGSLCSMVPASFIYKPCLVWRLQGSKNCWLSDYAPCIMAL